MLSYACVRPARGGASVFAEGSVGGSDGGERVLVAAEPDAGEGDEAGDQARKCVHGRVIGGLQDRVRMIATVVGLFSALWGTREFS